MKVLWFVLMVASCCPQEVSPEEAVREECLERCQAVHPANMEQEIRCVDFCVCVKTGGTVVATHDTGATKTCDPYDLLIR